MSTREIEASHFDKIQLQSSSLIWTNISVRISKKQQQLQTKDSGRILQNLSGIARSGEILAVMGPSGVGKTTLMNVLSGRHGRNMETEGKVYVNNRSTTRDDRVHSGLIEHVEQQEYFIETTTVEEHLIFQAMLRMPHEIPDDKRRLHVNDVMVRLHLDKSRTTPIGRLSGGEKKRLAFATALLTMPSILLIDEPTSGLDTYLAKSIMNIIHSIAIERNQVVIVVLHQPTNTILDLIHRVYLVIGDGQQAFFGTKDEALKFFVDDCYLSSNTLDGFIAQLSAPSEIIDDEKAVSAQTIVTHYEKSNYLTKLHEAIKNHLQSADSKHETSLPRTIERSMFGRQLKWLLWRMLCSIQRNPKRTSKLVFRLVVMALVLGIIFFRLGPNSENYIQRINAVLVLSFASLFEANMTLIIAEVTSERPLAIWEYRRQLYTVSAYYLSRLVIDTCFHIVTTALFISIVILMTGLSNGLSVIGIFILCIITGCSIANLIATIVRKSLTGLLICHPLLNTFAAFSGYFINIQTISPLVRWIKYISPHYYGFHLLLIAQWHNTPLDTPCTSSLSLTHLLTNASQIYDSKCNLGGDDVLYCFNTSYQLFWYYLIGLLILPILMHIITFLIAYYRIRRAA